MRALLLLLIAPRASAQESTSYKPNEHVLNSGGNPDGGVAPDGAPIITYYDVTNGDLKAAKCSNGLCLPFWTRR